MNKIENNVVNTIRVLSAETVQKANSGHPGLPLGAAPIAYAIWANQMKHSPKNLNWANRDRFILSAGHGSALIYSLFHLFGYGVSMDDLKNFRQLDSLTPGHPEFGHTKGVEITIPTWQIMLQFIEIKQAFFAPVNKKTGYLNGILFL